MTESVKRVVITEAETLVMNVDPGAFSLVTADARCVRQVIILCREGPRGAWVPDDDMYPGAHQSYAVPLHAVVYVQDGMALDEACAKRAANAVWPCDCGCMAE